MTDSNGSAVLVSVPSVERRINPFKPELRDGDGAGGPKHIVGYASVFNKLSRKLPGGFVERVDPGTFRSAKTQGWPGVIARFNHNDDFLLGTIQGRTLACDYDETGLMYDVIPPSFRSDIVELMQRGDVTSSSFAFRMPGDGGDDWALSDFGLPLRTLLDLELVDVAPVTTPAYPDATSQVRAFEGAVESLARKFDADPTEIRSLFSDNQTVRLFKRTDRTMFVPRNLPEVPEEIPSTPVEEPMNLDEQRAALYEEEVRAKYNADDREKMAANGQAMEGGRYPIADEEDLHNAIHAIGRGKGSHDAIKAHIKKRAAALGKTAMLPDDWKDGDSAPEKKSAEEESEERASMSEKPENTKASDVEDEEDETDEEDDDSEGNGTEDEGRSAEETPEVTEEATEERAEEEVHQSAGTSDNGHKVYSADEHRRMLAMLQDKRFDPFLDSED